MNFLTSIGMILLCGLVLGNVLKKIKIPSLVGALIVGIVLGPYVLDLLAPELITISGDIRKIALVIILTRAGLSFDYNELKQNGRSAIMLCFVPAIFEILGYALFGTLLLKLSIIESLIMGSVMAAVSPAVVVPRMLKLKEEGYGINKGIPQMILTGASADDIFVIILFTSLVATGGTSFDFNILWQTPVSIILGTGLGIVVGIFLSFVFSKIRLECMFKVIILFALSMLFLFLENTISEVVPYSALLSIIATGAVIYKNDKVIAREIASKYNDMWKIFEIFLFAFVGSILDLKYALSQSGMAVLVVLLCLVFRMAGVYLCVVGTNLTFKERLFCMVSYIPKATVQAAIGAIPLSMGLPCGSIILTVAVISILVTAPLGAFLTDILYKKLLEKEEYISEKCNINKNIISEH